MAEYRYKRCPSFCVGMIFALFDEVIRKRFVRWQILLALLLLIIMINFSHLPLNPLFYSSILFLSMYAIKDIKEMRIVKFISSISLEMFIIQYIPINTIICDFHFKSTFIVIILVITHDIILAYIMHRIISTISKNISNRKQECDLDKIYKIAMISTNGNKEISKNIHKIYKDYGMEV